MADQTTVNQASQKQAAADNGKKLADAGGKRRKERKLQEVTNDLPPVWGGDEGPSVGDVLEGFFVGSKSIKYRKSSFLTHLVQNEDTGEILSFSGAIADRKMARIPRDSYVRVTYLGEVRTSNGDAKDFRIETEEGVNLLDETVGGASA